MAAPSQGRERVNQKRRTRTALVDAAQRLLAHGNTPSVAEVADEALVSRATAYRYFPSQEYLLLDVVLHRSLDDLDRTMTAAAGDGDAAERVDRLVRAVHDEVAANETAFRSLARLSLERTSGEEPTVAGIRGERRLRWIDEALAPLRPELDETERRRLASALALCLGAEAFVVLHDLCGLDDAEAEDTLRWAARALVAAR